MLVSNIVYNHNFANVRTACRHSSWRQFSQENGWFKLQERPNSLRELVQNLRIMRIRRPAAARLRGARVLQRRAPDTRAGGVRPRRWPIPVTPDPAAPALPGDDWTDAEAWHLQLSNAHLMRRTSLDVCLRGPILP